jgi:formylglycine-generating enzyme required for sulfatase activity
MLTTSGQVKVLDLGLALLKGLPTEEDRELTDTGQLMGTLDYMAPEQGTDSHEVDVRADVYSLGATLYKLLSGEAPFAGRKYDTPVKKVMALATEPVAPICQRRPEVPQALAELLDRMLAKDPAERLAAPAEVGAAMAPFTVGCDLEGLLREANEKSDPPSETEPAVAVTDECRGSAVVETDPSTAPKPQVAPLPPGRRWKPWAIAVGVVLLAVCAGFALQIIIKILKGDQEMSVVPPPGAATTIEPEGAVKFTFPERDEQPSEVVSVEGEPPPRAVSPLSAFQAKELQQRWAEYLELPVEETNSIGMKLVLIPPGELDMGRPQAEIDRLIANLDENIPHEAQHKERLLWEWPQHRVKITRPFYVGMVEVTVGQFRRFTQASGYKTPAEKASGHGGYGIDRVTGERVQSIEYHWQNTGFKQTERHPVVNVDWNDANRFCQWLSREEGQTYRLPTEAEWEYACRAGTTTLYCFGDDEASLADYAWQGVNAYVAATHPVATKQPNPWGLYDVYGNVHEWCHDWFDPGYYGQSPRDDPSGPDTPSGKRVFRGGGWTSGTPWWYRSAQRGSTAPHHIHVDIGFRAVCEIGEKADEKTAGDPHKEEDEPRVEPQQSPDAKEPGAAYSAVEKP